MTSMKTSIFICLAALLLLLRILQRRQVSIGLPFAYLFLLLLNHVPGAVAHLVGSDVLLDSDMVAVGIHFTAIGSVCFVVGVWLAHVWNLKVPIYQEAPRKKFWLFCLIAGWFVVYGLAAFRNIPTLGAAIQASGAIWMLGVMLGLRNALKAHNLKLAGFWFAALLVYPILMLLLGGFMSYGSTSVIIVLSALAISKNYWRTAFVTIILAFIFVSIFLSYFLSRDAIRDAVWGGEAMEQRVEASSDIYKNFKWFNPSNPRHLRALDARLNQNYFVGVAAKRLQNGEVAYLDGRSLKEGLFALVPRVLWPEKPVYGGSPAIVLEMTGLVLDEYTTSWGVGNVMEFQINFGMAGVVVGFMILGWLLGFLDRQAAMAETCGQLGKIFIFFLPAVGLIQPIGSMVELVGCSVMAWGVAHAWQRLWKGFS